VITPEGLEKLKEELEYLQTVKRREVAERIKEAREFGDIAENAEYDDAKNEQAMLEQRIAQKSGDSRRFQIVGSAEANPAEEKLSNESPIGGALIGHKKGDVVSIDVPRGPKKRLKITKIEPG
jgi:transcription elongation factor GreA